MLYENCVGMLSASYLAFVLKHIHTHTREKMHINIQ